MSFLLEDCYLDNTTGSAEFGFSGQGHTIKFKFEDGDIIDFNDLRSGSGELRFWNYDVGKKFTISGDISPTMYSYTINDGSNSQSFRGITNEPVEYESSELM